MSLTTDIGVGDPGHAALHNQERDAINKLNAMVVTTKTASYTLALVDANTIVEMNVGTANNLTVPANSGVPFPIGTVIEVYQLGAGQTTVVADGGVTIRTPDTLKIDGQYATAALRKRATDEWVLDGRLEAA